MNKRIVNLTLLIVLVALVIWGVVIYAKKHSNSPTSALKTAITPKAEKTQVISLDVKTPSGQVPPENFPKDIPLVGNINENTKIVYTEKNMTQYLIKTTSTKSFDDIWKEYYDFLNKAGYKIDLSVTNKERGQISGNIDQNLLIIKIANGTSTRVVTLNYWDRK